MFSCSYEYSLFTIYISTSPSALHRLRTACEHTKRTLSTSHMTSVEDDSLFKGIDFSMEVTRACFEDHCRIPFSRVFQYVLTGINDSNMDKTNVHNVVLVGGSTRIPHMLHLVTEYFNSNVPIRSINPYEAVAYGTAVQAAILSGDTSEKLRHLTLQDIIPPLNWH
jgi:heat shock protein 1/8